MAGTLVRPLGRLEKLFTARHFLGFYNAVIVLGKYVNKDVYRQEALKTLVLQALAGVVSRHDILRCSIVNESGSDTRYVQSSETSLEKKVAFVRLSKGDSFLPHLEKYHDQFWRNQEENSPWQVVVFEYTGSKNSSAKDDSPTTFDLAFIYHHALCDGLSGVIFHTTFLNELRSMTSLDMKVQKEDDSFSKPTLDICAPVEELIDFKLSWRYLLGQVLKEYGPASIFRPKQHFSGLDCTLTEDISYKTKLHSLEINPRSTITLLAHCKSQTVSMTSLITASVVYALAVLIPEAEGLRGATPYSIRRLSGTDAETMTNQVSDFDTDYDQNILDEIRTSYSESSWQQTKRVLWKVANLHEVRLKSEMQRCPYDNVVGTLPYVSDIHEFYRKQIGGKRGKTFEVSNLGVIRPQKSDNDQWKLENAVFTQGATVVGPALCLNCAGILNGPMIITFTWQDKIIDGDLVSKVVKSMDSTLQQLTNLEKGQI